MKRISALAAGAVAVTALATGLGSAGAAAPDPAGPVGLAKTWLIAQLVDGAVPSSYGGANTGATIDAALSLRAVDPSADVSHEIDAVSAGLGAGYADTDESDCTQWAPDYSSCQGTFEFKQHGYYAGPTGKALAFAAATGQSLTAFGGRNLVTQLEARVQPSGRIKDDSYFGDYANVLGQAFAVAGLTAADSAKAAAAKAFLLTQQCADGSFPEQFAAAVVDKDKSCADAPRQGSVDTTATVILELHGIAGTDTALADAGAWLAAAQATDGGWTSTGVENANATGLAARALHVLGDDGVAAKGASWLANHQLVNLGACRSYPAAAVGAIAYDDAALADVSGGTATDQYRVAASQALPALGYLPAQDIQFLVPAIGVPAGGTVAVSVTGLRPGQQACLTGPGAPRLVTGTGGSVPVIVAVPAGSTTYTLTGSGFSKTFSVSAVATLPLPTTSTTPLGPAHLAVSAPAKVHAGRRIRVRIGGLAAGESVTVRALGKRLRVTADATGVAVVKLRLTTRKRGKVVLHVRGSLPTRTGTVKVRIVR